MINQSSSGKDAIILALVATSTHSFLTTLFWKEIAIFPYAINKSANLPVTITTLIHPLPNNVFNQINSVDQIDQDICPKFPTLEVIHINPGIKSNQLNQMKKIQISISKKTNLGTLTTLAGTTITSINGQSFDLVVEENGKQINLQTNDVHISHSQKVNNASNYGDTVYRTIDLSNSNNQIIILDQINNQIQNSLCTSFPITTTFQIKIKINVQSEYLLIEDPQNNRMRIFVRKNNNTVTIDQRICDGQVLIYEADNNIPVIEINQL